jgi:hypothetical protein
MVVNPFLVPPQVDSPQSRSWGRGLAFGFQSPPASQVEPADVQSEDPDAFQQGVLAGQQAAINGLDVMANQCVDMNAQGPFPEGVPDLAFGALEIADVIKLLAHRAFGGAAFGAVLALVDLSVGLQTHFDDPETELSKSAEQLRDLIAGMGITDSMELFLGGAIDLNQRGCELKLTQVFRFADKVRDAARNLGRQTVITVKWRTDQSGGLELVDFLD